MREIIEQAALAVRKLLKAFRGMVKRCTQPDHLRTRALKGVANARFKIARGEALQRLTDLVDWRGQVAREKQRCPRADQEAQQQRTQDQQETQKEAVALRQGLNRQAMTVGVHYRGLRPAIGILPDAKTGIG